ncbi:MAG: hypothetical protein ACR652_18905 [Methylocystis sp.]|uniref:hypothetical protein n=1 Tax=Methylocystis sp. TaxID=1911079 RepID=UPI003DA610AE
MEGAARPSNLIVSVLNKKASIADNFRAGGAVAENFGRRVGDEEEAAKLRPFLSYKGQTEPDAARRLETRSALCLAFGHGATTEDLGKLKASLDANADPMFSRFALAQLNSPGLDFWAFMERLPAPGQNFVEEVDLAHFEATHKNKAVNFVGERGSEYKSEDERSFRSVTAYCGDGYMDIRRRTRRFGPMEP